MKKIVTVGLTLIPFVFVGCQKSNFSATPKTEEEKIFYSVGSMYGSRFKSFDLNEAEINSLLAGVYDSAKGEAEKIKVSEYAMKWRDLYLKRTKEISEKETKKGSDYIQNFIQKEAGVKTESGLAYKILEKGTGEVPGPTDTVTVNYHGTLIDGTVFDSTRERGKPISFPLNRVIKGWTEGLQLVAKGGKIKLVIPADLAYGELGAPPKIPGGATLNFEIELLDTKKTEEGAAEEVKEEEESKK